jgi:uracil DNA glycosylase superfamily protein
MTSLWDGIKGLPSGRARPVTHNPKRAYCALLLGEANPHGSNPRYALYPEPVGCSGWRLCHLVMGLRSQTYLDWFIRANVFPSPPERWSRRAARLAAREVLAQQFGNYRNDRIVVVLGRKVAAACGVDVGTRDYQESDGYKFLFLPHPSSLNREWMIPHEPSRCREFLSNHMPNIPFGEAV